MSDSTTARIKAAYNSYSKDLGRPLTQPEKDAIRAHELRYLHGLRGKVKEATRKAKSKRN